MFQGDSEIDQLFRIFRSLGTPTETNWPGVTQLPDYKSTFPNWVGDKLEKLVPDFDETSLHLIREMLRYDPAKRITAKACFHHSYFQDFNPEGMPAIAEI